MPCVMSTDHIEWHGGVEAYREAKGAITAFQGAGDFLVVNEELAWRETQDMGGPPMPRAIPFGLRTHPRFDLLIPGEHNQLNAQAAFTAAQIAGVSWEEAHAAIRDYKGLPHRLSLVHEENGVRYFDDSIATVPEAAVAALDAFPRKKVLQIVGGYDKKLPFTDMCAALVERAKAVFCIGATGDKIADLLMGSTYQGGAQIFKCGDLATAMKQAKGMAATGDVVLLSPGCASFGQFDNFEKRGEEFARLASATPAPPASLASLTDPPPSGSPH